MKIEAETDNVYITLKKGESVSICNDEEDLFPIRISEGTYSWKIEKYGINNNRWEWHLISDKELEQREKETPHGS